MKTISRFFILVCMLLGSISGASAQGREYIRNCIERWDDCRNVAITKTNGDLALHGRNGYAVSECPTSLVNALKDLNNKNEYIDDVQLTENGNWLILYGDNGCRWQGIPYDLERTLRDYNNDNEVITSVTFNDDGDWVVITTKHFSTSNSGMTNWLKEGLEKHGKLWAVCVTDDAAVAVYENGYKFLGNVPDSLKDKLRTSSLDVYRLKIAGTSWFMADKKGNYSYKM